PSDLDWDRLPMHLCAKALLLLRELREGGSDPATVPSHLQAEWQELMRQVQEAQAAPPADETPWWAVPWGTGGRTRWGTWDRELDGFSAGEEPGAVKWIHVTRANRQRIPDAIRQTRREFNLGPPWGAGQVTWPSQANARFRELAGSEALLELQA